MHRTIFARVASVGYCAIFHVRRRQEIRLPRGKTQSIEGIDYVVSGQPLMLRGPSSGSPVGPDYREDLGGDDGGVLLCHAVQRMAHVSISMRRHLSSFDSRPAGSPARCRPDIIHALLFAVSDAFENRGTADMSQGRNFEVRETLISSYRLVRWY